MSTDILCPTCHGAGTYQKDEEDEETGLTTREVVYCEACKGYGIVLGGDGDVN